MASGPITSWQKNGETVETVVDLIFLGSKIIANGDCSHEIKRHLLFGRKLMTNLDSILKSRDITLSTKVHLVKPMVFPVVVYGCESWTIKKADRQRIDVLNCGVGEDSWESFGLQGEIQPVHLKGNQFWVFIGRTDVEAETPNILATWCEELTHLKRPWCWVGLKAGGEGNDKGWNGWTALLTQWA